MQKTVFAKAVLVAFGASLAAAAPSAPFPTAALQVCNDAALYCKYGNWKEQGIYETFPECLQEESKIRCPDYSAKSIDEALIARENSIEHERLG